jgi:hypothetical protein
MKEIRLTQGKFAQVDDEDFDYLNQFNWCTITSRNRYYVYHNTLGLMHRVITKVSGTDVVDHRDDNTLNNQKYNLRCCTNSQNMANMIKVGDGYKGVSWDKDRSKYFSKITCNYKQIYLGRFATEVEAAVAYNNAALKYFGAFANLNIIKENCHV